MAEHISPAPMVLIIFNRPDLTSQVMNAIANAKPEKLFVIADGPRKDKIGESEKCAAARKLTEDIRWPCEVFRNYSEENLGCRNRIASGLDWVFQRVDRAIILEDDCLPDQSFFDYCTTLLEHYETDTRIGCISGTNIDNTAQSTLASYYFSKYPLVWGWATWRRVWENYDVDIPHWGEIRNSRWLEGIAEDNEREHWRKAFDRVFEESFDTWDYQLVFTLWRQRQLTIQPSTNLISNVGFRPDATHTKEEHKLANMSRRAIEFPLVHPKDFNEDVGADSHYRAQNCKPRKRKNRLRRILHRLRNVR